MDLSLSRSFESKTSDVGGGYQIKILNTKSHFPLIESSVTSDEILTRLECWGHQTGLYQSQQV